MSSLGKEYDFHFLIPIRRGFAVHKAVEAVFQIIKPRNTRSVSFFSFDTDIMKN